MTRYIRVSSNGVARRVRPAITPSGGSGPPTVFVAASDASTKSLQTAAGMGAFGFVCDGTADQVELQAAVDVVNGLGFGRVQLSEGTFVLSDEVELYEVNLVGVGMGETVLSAAAGFAGTALLVNEVLNTPPGLNAAVRDLTLNGASNATYCYYQRLAGWTNITFDRVEVKNAANRGINLNRSACTMTLVGCWVHDNASSGINGEESLTIASDCDISDNGGMGFRTEFGGYKNRFENCRINGNAAHGIGSYGVWGATGGIIVVGCEITGNTSEGIRYEGNATGAPYSVIAGNRITGNGIAAIRVGPSSLVVGNVLDAAPVVGSGCTVAHNEGVGSGDHSDLDLADLGSGVAADNTVLTADGAGNTAFEVPAHGWLSGVGANDHHAEAHTVASHSDTTATGAELVTLTNGSNADALHDHDHGAITGLADDDHTQYPLLAGRAGGQTLIGGTGTTDDLTFQTTSGVGAAGADMHFKVGNNGATEALTILNDGNVGIGAAPGSYRLKIVGDPTIGSTVYVVPSITDLSNIDGVLVETTTAATVTGTYDLYGFSSQITPQTIPAGVVDSGARTAITGDAYATPAGFAGTLNRQIGIRGRAGLRTTVAATAVVTNAYGAYFEILNQKAGATITNAYGVYIQNDETVGTITNRWDVYAASANAKSYFAGKVGIGQTGPSQPLDVYGNFLVRSDGVAYWGNSAGNGCLSWDTNLAMMGGLAGNALALYANGEKARILTSGEVGIGIVAPTAKLHVDQSSATAAIPVLLLDQADVDEDFIKIIGTSDTSADRALVDAADFSTIGALKGYIKIYVQDDQATNPIVDGDYYIPFYAVPTA